MEILTTIPALFLDVKRYRINTWAVLMTFFALTAVVVQAKNIFIILFWLLGGLIVVWIISEKFYTRFSKNGFIYLTADEIIIEILSKESGAIESRDSYKWSDINKIVANNTANKIMARLWLFLNNGTQVRHSFANHFYDAKKPSVGVDIPKFVKQYNIGKSEESTIKLARY